MKQQSRQKNGGAPPSRKNRRPQAKRSADHGQLVHTGGMQKTTDLWHKSIDRIREASERQRRKINSSNRQFLIFIAKLFLTLMIISGAGMFFLWNMLDTYEQSTPEGAMSDYVRLLTQQNYDLIYKRSFDGFTQWNDAQSYTAWLKNRYEGVDLQRAVFTRKSYSEDRYQYYDMLVDQKTIATLELSWLETENRWNARTLVEDRNFSIELFSSAEVLINDMPLTETDRSIRAQRRLPHAERSAAVAAGNPLSHRWACRCAGGHCQRSEHDRGQRCAAGSLLRRPAAKHPAATANDSADSRGCDHLCDDDLRGCFLQ